MKIIEQLLKNNREWAAAVIADDPDFFHRLEHQQAPEFLWIGCSDSRVPANQITGLAPGEVFVHRNVANVVAETDFNMLAVLQYAVDVLKVRHVIVCGHYGCGGVNAALNNFRHGIIDNWLVGIRTLRRLHQDELAKLSTNEAFDRLCELNALSQGGHVTHTSIVEDAWAREQKLSVHSWIYRLDCGVITSLREPISSVEDRERLAPLSF